MKRFIPALILLVAIVGAIWYGHRPAKNPDPNHTHADFAVWMNGKQFDFTPVKYMEKELTPDQEAALDAKILSGSGDVVHTQEGLKLYLHLHDGNGHVVHRHRPGLGFGDFLTSIGFSLTDTCLTTDDGTKYCNDAIHVWKLYVNGTEVTPFQPNYIFNDSDHILLTYGSDQQEISHELSLMTDDACLYSRTCPWRGPAPTESCISDPTVPCKQ